jgi:hypothetical protein
MPPAGLVLAGGLVFLMTSAWRCEDFSYSSTAKK